MADVQVSLPAVTVLMAAYNAAEHIDAAIRSVLAQTLADFELLVVDDGSTDETAATARSFDDGRVRVVSMAENGGAAAARNHGLRAARAELVAILDADDLAYPERLERQAAYLHAHPECGLLGTAYHLVDDAGEVTGTVPVVCAPPLLRWALLTRNMFAHSSMMVRREAALAAGGYDETLRNAEDYDLWVKLAVRWEPAGLPQVLAAYRDNPRGLTATKPTLDVPGTIRVVQRALSAAAGRPVSLDAVRCLKGGPLGGSARAACVEAADALATALEQQLARDPGSWRYAAALLDDWHAQTERLPERAPATAPDIVLRSCRLVADAGAGTPTLVCPRHVGWAARTIARAARAAWRQTAHPSRRAHGS
jgi:hypothetical protein